MASDSLVKHNWKLEQVLDLFALPFNDLIFKSHSILRKCFPDNEVELCNLMNIKVGGCPENCSYCPQSSHYKTDVNASKLSSSEAVIDHVKNALNAGAQRVCMAASWRDVKDRDIDKLVNIIKEVKSQYNIELCLSCGMLLKQEHADKLKEAGLDYYNHNIDTSEDFYPAIITTRTYQERLDTVARVDKAGIKVCCGGIIGMGETVNDRAKMLLTLANMKEHPKSVPLNKLIRVPGTPLEDVKSLDDLDFVRVIAVARIMIPHAYVRIAAGRTEMSRESQALCFFAGANSIFIGEKLLTRPNPSLDFDKELLKDLKISPMQKVESECNDFIES